MVEGNFQSFSMLLLYCLYSVPKTWEGHQAPTKRPVPPNGTSLLILTLPGCRSLVSAGSCHPPYQTTDFRGHLFSRISSTSSNHPSFLVYSGKCRLGAACSISLLLARWSLSLSFLAPGAYYYKIMSVCPAASHNLWGAPMHGGGMSFH